MCDRAQSIASTIKSLIEQIPPGKDTSQLQSMYKKIFYMAPEICDSAWQDLFSILRQTYDTGEAYQHKMCVIYNKAYYEYVDIFIK